MGNDKDIAPYNDKGQKHGYWECYWPNGYIIYKCIYNNDKEIGYEEFYDIYGKLSKKYYL